MSALVPSHDPCDPADFRDPTNLSDFELDDRFDADAVSIRHVGGCDLDAGYWYVSMPTVAEMVKAATEHKCPTDDGADQ